MTNEEAISVLKTMIPPARRGDGKSTTHMMQAFAIRRAIEALHGQKTAKRINISGTDCRCSRCTSWNDMMDYYCWFCGAKLEEVDE